MSLAGPAHTVMWISGAQAGCYIAMVKPRGQDGDSDRSVFDDEGADDDTGTMVGVEKLTIAQERIATDVCR